MKNSSMTALASLGALLWIGCGDSTTGAGPSASAASAKPSATTAPTTTPKKEETPKLSVDELGPFINGERVTMKDPGAAEKLKKLVSALPVQGKAVDLAVIKKGRFADVSAVVKELGAAGATMVKITTETRADLPKELVVVPQVKGPKDPPKCSVVAMITAKFETDVWSVQGGAAKKHTKGMAGPDLSTAGETLKKELERCDSKVAYFSTAEGLDWEYAHMAGGAIVVNDAGKKIQDLVLLDEVPVPGRPIAVK